jgi:hypothetical protein
MNLTPLFKTHCSIGKSLLTPERVFDLAKDKLEDVWIIEDEFKGFLKFFSLSKENDLPFRFGIRLNICNDVNSETEKKESLHKAVIFALNDAGCKILYKLYAEYSEHGDCIDYNILKDYWDDSSLFMAIPFYDSFIYCNLHYFCHAIPDLSYINSVVFFIEDNDLPFDEPTAKSIQLFCQKNNYNSMNVKSIYYENREDAEAFQTYKGICGRNKFSKKLCLDNPCLDHFGSREFCWESFLDKIRLS